MYTKNLNLYLFNEIYIFYHINFSIGFWGK